MIRLQDSQLNMLISGPEERRDKILQWLSPLSMHEKQQDTLSRRQKGTGGWLLEDPAFLNWIEEGDSHPVLWCPGNRVYPIRAINVDFDDAYAL